MIADSIASTSAIEPASAPRYTAGGSGVPRTRLRIPVSRRMTSVIAMPANVVNTIAVPIRPGTKKSAYGMPSTVECRPSAPNASRPTGSTNVKNADWRLRQNSRCSQPTCRAARLLVTTRSPRPRP